MNIKDPVTWFWNSSERRIRAFWRLCLYAMLFLLLTIIIALIAAFSGIHSPTSAQPIVLLATFLSLWLAGRFLERRPMSDFGLALDASWWLDMVFGLVLGAALMTGTL